MSLTIQSNQQFHLLPLRVAVCSSSPLLSLVTSTSEISHQPGNTYTTYIWQGGRQNRKTGNWRKYSIYVRKVRREKKKITPRLCSLGSTVWEQKKKHLSTKSTYTINTRLLQQGKTNPAPASSHPVQQPFSAPVTDPLAGSKRTEARDGGRGSKCL